MCQQPTKLRRHFLTGEWEEVPCDTEDGRATFISTEDGVVEGVGEVRKNVSAWTKPWESRAMGVPIHQMKQANAAAQAAGTGAYYEPGKNGKYAVCKCPTRRSRNLEMRRKNRADADAGYGDYAGK